MSIMINILKQYRGKKLDTNFATNLTSELLQSHCNKLDSSQLSQITNDFSLITGTNKIIALLAVINFLKEKFKTESDENYYLSLTTDLISFTQMTLNSIIKMSLSFTFNAEDEVFCKTVIAAVNLFLKLMDKSFDLGNAVIKECSPQIFTIITSNNLSFSVRKETAILYAEQIPQCDMKVTKKIAQTQFFLLSSLVQWIPQCGDFHLQESLVDIAVYICFPTEKKLSLIKKWFANAEFDFAIDSLSFKNLTSSTRTCLNYINNLTKPKKIFTLACKKFLGDSVPIHKPQDEDYKELWIDFCTSSKCIQVVYGSDVDNSVWKRLLIYFDNIKEIDYSTTNNLVKQNGETYQLRLLLKEALPVITLGRHFNVSNFTMMFLDRYPLNEVIQGFLAPAFPNLKNRISMEGFNSPDPVSKIKLDQSLTNAKIKDISSRVLSYLSTPSKMTLVNNAEDHLLKYSNITSARKDILSESRKFIDESAFNDCSSVQNATFTSHSSSNTSFVTELAKLKSPRNFTNKFSSLNDSWKSKLHFQNICTVSSDLRKDDTIKTRECDPLTKVVTDKEKLEKELNYNLFDGNAEFSDKNLDLSVAPNPSDDEYVDELRCAPNDNIVSLMFDEILIPEHEKKCNDNYDKINDSLSLLVNNNDSSDGSDIIPNRHDFSTIKKFKLHLDKAPLPDYGSDDSVEALQMKRKERPSLKNKISYLNNAESPDSDQIQFSKSEEISCISNRSKKSSNVNDLKSINGIKSSNLNTKPVQSLESINNFSASINNYSELDSIAFKPFIPVRNSLTCSSNNEKFEHSQLLKSTGKPPIVDKEKSVVISSQSSHENITHRKTIKRSKFSAMKYLKQSTSPALTFDSVKEVNSLKSMEANTVTSPIDRRESPMRLSIKHPVVEAKKNSVVSCKGSEFKNMTMSKDKMFKPISTAATPNSLGRAPSSLRSSDASSKMELEQIFYQSIKNNDTSKPAYTPFRDQNSRTFVDLCINANKKSLEAEVTLVDSSDISNHDDNDLKPDCVQKNANTNNNSMSLLPHDSSRQTVPPSSDSDISNYMSPKEEGSTQINFSRLINTDANNNTLVSKKSSLKACSPLVLPLTKPSRTYIKKSNPTVNHTWFQSMSNKKRNANVAGASQPVRKRQLFHLATFCQEPISSESSDQEPVLKPKVESEKYKSPSLYDIIELDENSVEEVQYVSLQRKIPVKKNDDSNKKVKQEKTESESNRPCRRSTRNKKNISYKEFFDSKTDESLFNIQKNEIKSIILKNIKTKVNSETSLIDPMSSNSKKISERRVKTELVKDSSEAINVENESDVNRIVLDQDCVKDAVVSTPVSSRCRSTTRKKPGKVEVCGADNRSSSKKGDGLDMKLKQNDDKNKCSEGSVARVKYDTRSASANKIKMDTETPTTTKRFKSNNEPCGFSPERDRGNINQITSPCDVEAIQSGIKSPGNNFSFRTVSVEVDVHQRNTPDSLKDRNASTTKATEENLVFDERVPSPHFNGFKQNKLNNLTTITNIVNDIQNNVSTINDNVSCIKSNMSLLVSLLSSQKKD